MVFSIILLAFCLLFCCGVFDSKERKAELAKEKRKSDCICGKIPYGQMTWKEQILYAQHNNLKWQLIKLVNENLIRMSSTEMDNDFNEAIHTVLHYEYYERKIPLIQFVSKYSKVLAKRYYWVYERPLLDNCKYGSNNSPETRRMACEILKKDAADDEIKHDFEKAIKAIDLSIEAKTHEEYLRHIENNGGFSNVKDGEGYERFVAFCVNDAGYDCEIVGQSGDYGADILANIHGVKTAIQCKFYSQPVGFFAVQEAHTAKSYYDCSKACVVSNAGFTPQAKIGARKVGVKLLHHSELKKYLDSI